MDMQTPTPGAVPQAPAGNASQSDAGGPVDDQSAAPAAMPVDPMAAPAADMAPAAAPVDAPQPEADGPMAQAMDMTPAAAPVDEPVVGGMAEENEPASAEAAAPAGSAPVANDNPQPEADGPMAQMAVPAVDDAGTTPPPAV